MNAYTIWECPACQHRETFGAMHEDTPVYCGKTNADLSQICGHRMQRIQSVIMNDPITTLLTR
jgi:hypothetical protein